MAEPVPHILFLGGKPRNIPEKNLLCTWEQIDQDEAERRDPGFKRIPTVILVMKDFLGHSAYDRFKEKAGLLRVPFVVSSGGFGALIAAAKEQGLDLSKWVKNGAEPAKEEPAPAPVIVTSGQKPQLSEDMKLWLGRSCPTSKEMVASKGRRVQVTAVRGGKLSLVLKGLPLEMALEEIRRRGWDKEHLSPDRSERIADYLSEELGLDKIGAHLTPASVQRVSNFLHGFMTEGEKERVRDQRKKKKQAKRAKTAPTPSPAPSPAASSVPTPAVPPAEPAQPKSPTTQALVVHLSHRDEVEKKLIGLYEKVLAMTAENASFIEQIERLEGILKTRDEELKKSGAEIQKWKDIASK
jgi:hypothetical protein